MLSLIKTLIPAKFLGIKTDADPATLIANVVESLTPDEESTLLRTVGWVSAGLGALAVGLFVGRELRQRYKFNRRTPYDFYAHSGGEDHDLEFGVGV